MPDVLNVVPPERALRILLEQLEPALAREATKRLPLEKRPGVTASMTRKVQSPLGEDEYLRVKLGRVGEQLVATPVQQGAGVITSLVRADGLVLIPRFSEGLDAGTQVQVELLRSLEEVENTIVAIGSHDLTLDLMASHLRRLGARAARPVNLSSSHVGSLRGLVALRRGEAHLAGSHLLDEETGGVQPAIHAARLARCAGGGGLSSGPGPGPDFTPRQPEGHQRSSRPGAVRHHLRQPAAGFGHQVVAGL